MTSAAAPAALLEDVLWCVGLGCLLGAGRGLLSLAVGDGPVRRFACDLIGFVAAAFLLTGFSAAASAAGLARWYMAAAMAAGAFCWQYSVQYAFGRLLQEVVALCMLPGQIFTKKLLTPVKNRISPEYRSKKQSRCVKKVQKQQKKSKKQLPNPSKVYYN